MKTTLGKNELYRIYDENGEEHFFTSLHRASLFDNSESPNRAGFEYALLKGKSYHGWRVEIVDGTKITWGNIDNE